MRMADIAACFESAVLHLYANLSVGIAKRGTLVDAPVHFFHREKAVITLVVENALLNLT